MAKVVAQAHQHQMNPLWRPPGIGPGIGRPRYDSGLFDGEQEKERNNSLQNAPPWKPPGVPRIEYYNYYSHMPSSSSSSSSSSEGEPGETPEERAERKAMKRAERRTARAAARGAGLAGENSGSSLGTRLNGRQPWRFTYAVDEGSGPSGNDPPQVKYETIMRDEKPAPRPWKYTVNVEPVRNVPYNIWGPYVDPGRNATTNPGKHDTLLSTAMRRMNSEPVDAVNGMTRVRGQRGPASISGATAADGGSQSSIGGGASCSISGAVAAMAVELSAANAAADGVDTEPPSPYGEGAAAAVGGDVEAADNADVHLDLEGMADTAAARRRPTGRKSKPLRRNMSMPHLGLRSAGTQRFFSARHQRNRSTSTIGGPASIPSYVVLSPEAAAAAASEALVPLVTVSTHDSTAALHGLPYELSVMGRSALPSPTRVSGAAVCESSDGGSCSGEASLYDEREGTRTGMWLGPRPASPLSRMSPSFPNEAIEAEGSQGPVTSNGDGGVAPAIVLSMSGMAAVGEGEDAAAQADAAAAAGEAMAPGGGGGDGDAQIGPAIGEPYTDLAVAAAAAVLALGEPTRPRLSLLQHQLPLEHLQQKLLLLQQERTEESLDSDDFGEGPVEGDPSLLDAAAAVAVPLAAGTAAEEESALVQLPPPPPPPPEPSDPPSPTAALPSPASPGPLSPSTSRLGFFRSSPYPNGTASFAPELCITYTSRGTIKRRSRHWRRSYDVPSADCSDESDTGGGGSGGRARSQERGAPRLYPPAGYPITDGVQPKRICSAGRRGAFSTAGIQPYPLDLDPMVIRSLPLNLRIRERARSAPGSPRGSLNAHTQPNIEASAPAAVAAGGAGPGIGGIGGGGGGGGTISSAMNITSATAAEKSYETVDSYGSAPVTGPAPQAMLFTRDNLPPLPAILQDPRSQDFFTSRGAHIISNRRQAAKTCVQPDARAMYELLLLGRCVRNEESYGGTQTHGPRRKLISVGGSSQIGSLLDAHHKAQSKLGSAWTAERGTTTANMASSSSAAATAAPLPASQYLSPRSSFIHSHSTAALPPVRQSGMPYQASGVTPLIHSPLPLTPSLLPPLLPGGIFPSTETVRRSALTPAAFITPPATAATVLFPPPPPPPYSQYTFVAAPGPQAAPELPPPLISGSRPSSSRDLAAVTVPMSEPPPPPLPPPLARGSSALRLLQPPVQQHMPPGAASGSSEAPPAVLPPPPLLRAGSRSGSREGARDSLVRVASLRDAGQNRLGSPPAYGTGGSLAQTLTDINMNAAVPSVASSAPLLSLMDVARPGSSHTELPPYSIGGVAAAAETPSGGAAVDVAAVAASAATHPPPLAESNSWSGLLPPITASISIPPQSFPQPAVMPQLHQSQQPLPSGTAVQLQLVQQYPPHLPQTPPTPHLSHSHSLQQQPPPLPLPQQQQQQQQQGFSTRTSRNVSPNSRSTSSPPARTAVAVPHAATAASPVLHAPPIGRSPNSTPRLPAVAPQRRLVAALLDGGGAAAAALAVPAAFGSALEPPGSADTTSSSGNGSGLRRKGKGQLRVGRAPLGPPLASRLPEKPPGS
ncbi:hypothetical protein Vretimale_8974 [Volvox reticuliferus]|uniref:Uncharacterized protein n=3 Tax=Volvox reticuliferus TaxID=1737510 RepID=A0A8J4LNV5_9CHLO|nr:hypothetical protein Vretimale_8974 [Volvox reticuliferus]